MVMFCFLLGLIRRCFWSMIMLSRWVRWSWPLHMVFPRRQTTT